MKTIGILGSGYVAQFLVKKFSKTYNVVVVSRKSEPIDGAHLITFGEPLPPIDGIISTVPPVDGIDPVLEKYQFTCWTAYCSSTGVYGNHDGNWVTEESECRPTSLRGQQRLEIEQEWLKSPNTCILRLAGIYGPGRSVIDQINAGAQRIDKPGHAFSRIHVEDIAGFANFAFENALTGIFNLADDLPAPTRAVIEYACDLQNLPYPPLVPFEQANLSPMATDFYNDHKKVSNQKIKDADFTLIYNDYRKGLDKIIKNN